MGGDGQLGPPQLWLCPQAATWLLPARHLHSVGQNNGTGSGGAGWRLRASLRDGAGSSDHGSRVTITPKPASLASRTPAPETPVMSLPGTAATAPLCPQVVETHNSTMGEAHRLCFRVTGQPMTKRKPISTRLWEVLTEDWVSWPKYWERVSSTAKGTPGCTAERGL